MAAPLRMRLSTWALPDQAATSAGRLPSTLPIAGVVVLIAVLARVALPIPGTPVPITLQDLAVLAVGVFMGPSRGALAVACYLATGALGAPVFSNGHGGLGWLMGPTGGYLLAYPLAAFLAGHAARPGRPWLLALAWVLAAQLVVFTGGLLQLVLLTGQDVASVVPLAVIPFLPGAAIKTVLVVALAVALQRARRGVRDGAA